MGESTTSGDGGDLEGAGVDPGTGQGGEGEGTKKPGTGEDPKGGGEGEGGKGGATIDQGLDRSKLNPALASLDEAQLNTLFGQLLTSYRGEGEPSKEAIPGVTGGQRPEPKEPDKAPEPINWAEAFDPNSEKFDPEAALNTFVDRNFKGFFTDLAGRTVSGSMDRLERQNPGFDKLRPRVEAMMREGGVDPTTIDETRLLGMYYMVKGYEATDAERRKAAVASGQTTLTPKPPEAEDLGGVGGMTDDEKVAAEILYSDLKPAEAYKRYAVTAKAVLDESFTVPVPGDE